MRAKKSVESYPKCVGAATFQFMPVHNVGWSLPVNPMKKSTSHEKFTHPSLAYSVSQLKAMEAESSIATDFSSRLAKLSSGVRLEPPILASLSTDTYKKPAKYGYQQNIFKYKNSAPMISGSGSRDEESGGHTVESWNVKKDFAFVREGDGGRNILEIKDSKKSFIGMGLVFDLTLVLSRVYPCLTPTLRYRPPSSVPISRPYEAMCSTTNQYQTSNRQYLTDHSALSEKIDAQVHQKLQNYRNSLESSKTALLAFEPRLQKTNFRVFENVGGIPVIHEAKDANAQAMRKLINFVKPSAAQCVLQDIIYSM